jgi:hypothetical protein
LSESSEAFGAHFGLSAPKMNGLRRYAYTPLG